MASLTKDRQISIRLPSETDAWLERRAGNGKNKAGFIRQLIEREMTREREMKLLEMFNAAAADLTPQDLEERESLVAGFSGAISRRWPPRNGCARSTSRCG